VIKRTLFHRTVNPRHAFRHDFKLNGYYRLPAGFSIELAWQSYLAPASTTTGIERTIYYPVPAGPSRS